MVMKLDSTGAKHRPLTLRYLEDVELAQKAKLYSAKQRL
jgi:hypothetical protein